MSSNGQTVAAVAGQQDLKPEAIRERRRKWRENGLGSLPGQPRCGAPSKLVDGHRGQLKKWVDAGPLACRTLASRLTADCGVTISAGTLRNELKRMGHVWKRTRHSLKKSVIRSDSNKSSDIIKELELIEISHIYIMCDPATKTDYLESFILSTIPDAERNCIKTFLDCSQFKSKENHKAILNQIYNLAYPNAPYNFEHPHFNDLKSTLTQLFD